MDFRQGDFIVSNFDHPQAEAKVLWDMTTEIARKHGVSLP